MKELASTFRRRASWGEDEPGDCGPALQRQQTRKDGGTGRRAAVDQSAASVGGKVEALYFAFGGADTYTIVDLPSNADMASLAATIAASGAVKIETVVLLTPKEIDEAWARSPGADSCGNECIVTSFDPHID